MAAALPRRGQVSTFAFILPGLPAALYTLGKREKRTEGIIIGQSCNASPRPPHQRCPSGDWSGDHQTQVRLVISRNGGTDPGRSLIAVIAVMTVLSVSANPGLSHRSRQVEQGGGGITSLEQHGDLV